MNSLLATVRFEMSRTLTMSRIVWWFVLAAFPIVIAVLIRLFPLAEVDLDYPAGFVADQHIDAEDALKAARDRQMKQLHQVWALALYALIPCITCAMGVLLSAAPAIATELEQRSWVYMATRPNGIFWLLTGKYIVAVVWAVTAAWVGLSVAVLITGLDTMLKLWISLSGLSVLSAMAYAAVFMLIGTLFPARAMVFCVAWTAAVEGMISLIPAVINRMTVQFRLRTLFVTWAEPGEEIRQIPFFESVVADGSSLLQVLWLITLTVVFFVAAVVIAYKREFTGAAETDV